MPVSQPAGGVPAEQLDAIRKKATELIDRADTAKELAAAMRLLRDVSTPIEGSDESQSKLEIMAEQAVRKSDVADFFGVAPQTVQCWVMRGMPSESHGHGVAARFNLRECARWLVRQRTTTEAAVELGNSGSRKSRDEYMELKVRKLKGELVDWAMVQDLVNEFSVMLRQMVDDAQRSLGAEGVEALNRIADRIREHFATLPQDGIDTAPSPIGYAKTGRETQRNHKSAHRKPRNGKRVGRNA